MVSLALRGSAENGQKFCWSFRHIILGNSYKISSAVKASKLKKKKNITLVLKDEKKKKKKIWSGFASSDSE